MACTHGRLIATAMVVGWAGACLAGEQTSGGSTSVAAATTVVGADLSVIAKQLSNDCRVKSPAFEGRAPLRMVRRAIREQRPIRVLAVGSSSTVGVGASSPVASYPVRLENDLEGFLKGFDVQMIARGISGEIAEGAAERIKLEVAEAKPDLVVWQVGTNDAMARVEDDDFAEQLRTTVNWLKEHRVDVVLIDPQYVERLAKDEHYARIVEIITEVAREYRVLLVHRFHAMRDLSRERPNKDYLAADYFHLNDLGYRCMAEYAARAIVAGILQAEQDPAQPVR
jgi:lysophospholipase L1-like esterase